MSVNRNAFYSFIIQVPVLVLNLAASIFITRVLGAGGRGVYALAQNDVQLFGLVLSFSLNAGIVYYVAKKAIDPARLAGIALLFLVSGLILLFLFLAPSHLLGWHYYPIPDGVSGRFFTAYYCVSFFLGIFNALATAFFHGQSRFRVINGMTLFAAVTNLGLFAVVFLLQQRGLGSFGVRELLLLGLGPLLLNSGLWLFFYIRYIGAFPSFAFRFREHIRPLLGFVLTGHLSNLINFISYRVDLYFVDYFDASGRHDQAGYYSLAANIAQMFWMISVPLSTVLQPYLAAGDQPEKMKTFGFFSRVNIAFVLATLVPAGLLAPFLFPLLYGPDFAQSVTAFYLLLPGIVATCMTKIFSTYIYSTGKVQYNLISTVAGAALTIVLDLLLIPAWGIEGAAVASSCAYTVVLLFVLWFFYKRSGARRANYYVMTRDDIREIAKKAADIFGKK